MRMAGGQKQRMIKEGVKPIIYYLPDIKGAVCLLMNGEQIVARGVSVCSPQDQYIKQVGRSKAIGYAMQAYIKGKSRVWGTYMGDGRKANSYAVTASRRFRFQAEYLPTATEMEVAILEKSNK